jgi:hypothetical protein
MFQDEKEYRTFIVWLENQKIRLYTIEDRERLDDTEDINWMSALNKVAIYLALIAKIAIFFEGFLFVN